MLDQMSGGRLQVGVGRGISPIETAYYGIDPEQSQAMYMEAFGVLMKALTGEVVDHEGKFFRFRDVPIQMHPLQQPHPPLWYGVGNPEGVDWCVANRVNAVVNGSLDRVRQIADRYRAEWVKAGNLISEIPFVGTTRHVVVAETDAEAHEIAQRAYARWYTDFMYLWNKHGASPQFAQFPKDIDSACAQGMAVVGSPDTVREILAEQVGHMGVNYLLCRFAFGDMTRAESSRSVEMFAAHVMPAFSSAERVAA